MEERCADCGFDKSTAAADEVAAVLPTVASAVTESMRALVSDVARRRPAPDVWAPVEYLGHLRESMAFHRWLIERALTEERPAISTVDPDASVADANYRAGDIEDIIGQFRRRIDRFTELLATLDEAAMSRTALLGDREITVGLIARSAWHECHHHLDDIRRIGALDR